MCGINGLFAYSADASPVTRGELIATRDRMAARGPDGVGEWLSHDGRVGLGHRRLSIIDPRAIANQPMESDDGALVIVFNGEIYNYQALRDALVAAGHRFRTTSDTEVLLHLYAQDGEAMTRHLRGMYAFAIWDRRRRGMFLARDPLGIKPLYYADDRRTFRFASQVKALLAGGHVDAAAEPAGHAGFLLWGFVPDPFTLFKAIRGLPAGHTLWVDEAGARKPVGFFDLAATLASATPLAVDPAARRERLREALVDTVRHHLVSDVPVGVFLSAGLDSTTIAALACEGGAANLRTLTLGFREFAGSINDETALAETVACQLGTHHETRWVKGEEFTRARQQVMAAMDQPSIDGVNTYFVAEQAQAAGLKVALSGLGGDELLGGYPGFRQIPRLVEALRPLAFLSGLGRGLRQVATPWLGRFTSPKYAGLLEYGASYAGAYLLRRSLHMPWELDRLLPATMAKDGLERLATIPSLAASHARLGDPRRIVMALEMQWYMRHMLLRDADWAGMAHSVEIRVPLVDAHLLAELAPLFAGGFAPSKADIAACCAVPLPADVRARPKTGFVVPVRAWVMGEAARGKPAPDGAGLREWAKYVYAAQAPDAAHEWRQRRAA